MFVLSYIGNHQQNNYSNQACFNPNWKQIVFDATMRRQVPFQAVIIGLVSDETLDPVIVSSCIFMENESAQKEVDSI